jgi:hypothetical protein
MRAKNIGPNYEITVDGRPLSDRVLRTCRRPIRAVPDDRTRNKRSRCLTTRFKAAEFLEAFGAFPPRIVDCGAL